MLDPNTFAANWIAAWNARDLPAVLSMFADDARFSSPKAPNGATNGKAELAAYWSAALDKIPTLRFDLIEAKPAPTKSSSITKPPSTKPPAARWNFSPFIGTAWSKKPTPSTALSS